VPAEVKADFLRVLLAAGFEHVDALSFVSGEAVPQMADAETVLDFLQAPEDVELIAMVANARGAERVVKVGGVSTLLFSYSISPGFLDRNQRQTPEDALEQMEQVGEIAYKAGLDMAANVAMAFGNPYGDAWDIDEVVSAADLLVDAGVDQVVLDDTAGVASAQLLADATRLVLDVHTELEIGLSLRSRPEEAAEKVQAAFEAGCRRFHSVLGGVGGGEFAEDTGVRSLATEMLLQTLTEIGAQVPELEPLDRLIAANVGMAKRYA
jgi:hydroxymethylglutaryl-CoA lyase